LVFKFTLFFVQSKTLKGANSFNQLSIFEKRSERHVTSLSTVNISHAET